jgi:hypothetical protein
LRTLVYNLDQNRLEIFGTKQTPDLTLGELARIAMARPSDAVRIEGELYVDGATIEAQPATRLMLDGFDQVFALDVTGGGGVRPGGRLISIEPFDDSVSSGMDLYDLFIDRRRWPDRMLAGYRATRDALAPFAKRPAQRRSGGKEAAGS